MRPKIVVEIWILIHRKDLYCMWFSVPMFHVGRILTKILWPFLSENTVCPLLMLANFETFESWIQPDTILQRFFPIQFLQVQDKAKLFLVMQPLWASCVSMSHYTVTVFLYRIFFFLIFAFVYVHLACRCPIVWKINLFFSQIFACACAFL